MCYMESVGVRELRQNASALLSRVESTGEGIEITNHGHPVAWLVPVPRRRRARQDLIDAGLLRPAVGELLDLEPIEAPPGTPGTDELLADARIER